MKFNVPLKIEKLSKDVDCEEGIIKVIRYRVSNTNRFVIRSIDITAQTIKEDGEKTRSNFCKDITGVKPQLLPNEDFEISCTIKLNKEYNETVEIDGKLELSALELDVTATGVLYIAKT